MRPIRGHKISLVSGVGYKARALNVTYLLFLAENRNQDSVSIALPVYL